jgi:hypothetical protein
MTPPFLGLGLGLGSAATRRGGGFTPADLAGLEARWIATEGVFKTGPAAAGDGETVLTWVDADRSRTLTRTAASTALVYDLDAGPSGGPAVIFSGAALSVAWGENLSEPWMYAIIRFDAFSVSGMFFDSEASGRVFCQRYAAGLLAASAGSSISGLGIEVGTWGLLVVCNGLPGFFDWRGSKTAINTGTNTAENLIIGRDFTGGSPVNISVAEIGAGTGVISDEDLASLRAYAAAKYGL